jgi:hypothetical protein
MIVDRDKAIEKVLRALADFWGNGSTYEHCAAVIRQLTLEDCRVESTPHRKAVVDFLEQEANDLLAGKHKKGYRLREIADLIESLSQGKPNSVVQGTHWEGCEQAHHDCALAKLDAALRRQEKI